MRYRNLGHSGLKVSEVGLGSWLTFGRSVDQKTTTACVHRAFDLGVIFFDTADIYARGRGETAMGRALKDFRRSDYVLATKVFWPMSENPNDAGLSRKHIIESCEASLKRCGVDYFDLYQCHRFDPHVPLDEVVRAMDQLIRDGKVLYWGVSVWSAQQIEHAVGIADRFLAYRPISNQPPYNLLQREIEAEVIPTSKRVGLGQVVFSPLAEGVLTGKYAGGKVPKGSRADDPKTRQFMEPHLNDETFERVERLGEIAGGLGLTPAALALAWCLRDDDVASVIAGATRVEHVEENVNGSGVEIPADVMAELDTLFPAIGVTDS